ncbi:hypothetical protein C8Q78DRAFT_1082590 [Trametes maxima]|nr:hypothetical protein C8Q78DRAFT_1082590 [Trametes maxima]
MAVPEEQDTKSPSNNATPTDHHANRTDPGVHSPATSSGTTINHAAQPTAGDSQLPPKPTKGHLEALINKRETLYTEEERAQAWSDAAEMVNRYSDDMIKRWNKEIDTYLVYAGLFSAILTAFNVQSYPLLQPYTPDPAVEALLRISAQLSSFSVSPGFINSTTPSPASDIAAGNVADQSSTPRSAIWLNALWFSSLILSLSSASIGIMVKQWLNEYSSGVYGTSRESARLRQYRLNGLVKWRVADIVMTTPVLLQFSLALFLSGLLVLLWPLNRDVAILASVLIGALAIFTLLSLYIPYAKEGCSIHYGVFGIVYLEPLRLSTSWAQNS